MPPPRPSSPPGDASRELEQLRRVLSRREVELSRFATERDMLRTRVAERDARIRELEEQVAAKAGSTKADAEREARLESLAQALSASQRRVAELEAALAARPDPGRVEGELVRRTTELEELRRSVAELSAIDRERMQKLEAEAAREREKARRLQQELSEAFAWAPDPEDDLKRLAGVGPAFERSLKAIGVRTFAQIADWTDADIDATAPRIKTTPARIRRDDWVGSARKLCGR